MAIKRLACIKIAAKRQRTPRMPFAALVAIQAAVVDAAVTPCIRYDGARTHKQAHSATRTLNGSACARAHDASNVASRSARGAAWRTHARVCSGASRGALALSICAAVCASRALNTSLCCRCCARSTTRRGITGDNMLRLRGARSAAQRAYLL